MEKSPLMKLPPELRNHIYELVLVAEDPIVVDSSSPVQWKESAMLQTCRGIRAEAAAMYYSRNVFAVRPSLGIFSRRGATTFETLVEWLNALGQSPRDLLKDVRFDDLMYKPRATAVCRLEACRDLLAREGLTLRARLWLELEPDGSKEAGEGEWVHD